MRIPLILNFFSEESRLKALRTKSIQEVLDAALFEPGAWQEDIVKSCPDQVPASNRDHLCTPVGLLFNEIITAPHILFKSVQHMLEKVIDMDTGKYSGISDAILYVVRLCVRVEAYMLFLYKHHMFHEDQAARNTADKTGLGIMVYNGSDAEATVRGLHCSRTVLADALVCQKNLRTLLDDKVFKIIARWIKASKAEGKMLQACMLHANLAYLYRNVEADDLNPRIVFTSLASQIFLFNNYKYDLDLNTSTDSVKSRVEADEEIKDDLGVPQVELFDMFQRNRSKILHWLNVNSAGRNLVMDAIVQLVEEGMRTKDKAQDSVSDKDRVARSWVPVELTGMNFKGRFALGNEHDKDRFTTGLSKKAKVHFETWMREVTTLAINTEINVQMGEFTIKKNATRPLEDDMKNHPDFVANFEKAKLHSDVVQCADVKITKYRKWVRLIGLGVDLQLWAPDPREHAHANKVPYEMIDTPWVRDIMDMWKNRLLLGVELFASSQNFDSATSCVLYGTAEPDDDDSDHMTTLKEIVLHRYPRVMNIFNIIEHGRRLYRSLTFCSDANFSLHTLKTENLQLNERMYQVCGDPTVLNSKSTSMVILRDMSHDPTTEEELITGKKTLDSGNAVVGESNVDGGLRDYVNLQKYIPNVLLHGIMPSAITEKYLFWQNADESLTGYLKSSNTGPYHNLIRVKLTKKGPEDESGMGLSLADAVITRQPLKELDESLKEASQVSDHILQYSAVEDNSKPKMYLLSLIDVLASFQPTYNDNSMRLGPPVKTNELADFEGESMSLHALVRIMLRLEKRIQHSSLEPG